MYNAFKLSLSILVSSLYPKARSMRRVQILLLLAVCKWVVTLAGRPLGNVPAAVRREVYDNGRIFDITHMINPRMPTWDSKNGLGEAVKLVASMKNGSIDNLSEMKFSSHTGTHVDAPSHFIEEYFEAGYDTSTLDLKTLNAQVMKSLKIPKGIRRVLFRTLNTDRKLMFKKEFDSSYVGFLSEGAKWLVQNTDIKLVGLDYLSVAAYTDLNQTHLTLLRSRKIVVLEGLKLDDIKPGLYNLHCLPIRVLGADGTPTRCILME
ncbi:hypothetical protein MANES_07G067900v8 [Manihot esculenta]|uniref:Uncharacterized protein n=1 Tax=Manihot esculenta TaxID=3983 RepID=A0ACB7HDX8_MANES|nr:hypothetical protein MANES_07G067900v8 [Manihot esculenta]